MDRVLIPFQVIDFGEAALDTTRGVAFSGTEAECCAWIERHGHDRASDGKPRFCLSDPAEKGEA